ncbi:MAG: Fic family protein [Candidatus Delongbacteria bacterium]
MENKLKFDFNTTQKVMNLIGYIDSFKGKWESGVKKDSRFLKELRKIATVESIGSSTRIEGSAMSDDEIGKLLKDIGIRKFETRDEQEVAGYYNTLEIIFSNYESIDLNENYIKQLHGILLKESDKDQSHRGKYKQLSNKVVANYPDGTQKVLFNTTEPYLTQKEMTELMDWYEKVSSGNMIHPLIVTATFIYEFLSIHPFQDGNGRLSRLLTTMLLLKAGYDFVQYISFEHIIEKRKPEYYTALISAQKNRGLETEIISEWSLFFLSCMEELIKKLQLKYDPEKSKGGYLNERQKKVLELIREKKFAKTGDIALELRTYSINTIKKDLKYMVSENIITSTGTGRGTVYSILSCS